MYDQILSWIATVLMLLVALFFVVMLLVPRDHRSNRSESAKRKSDGVEAPERRVQLAPHLLTNATDVKTVERTTTKRSSGSHDQEAAAAVYHDYRYIGSGSFADVFSAKDEAGKTVAIKRLRRASDHEAVSEKLFRREVHLLSSLNSVAIPRLIEQRLDAARPYFVMEFIDGVTLSDRIALHGPLKDVELVLFAGYTAHAMGLIHQSGFLHRDIKPSNVIVSDSRSVLIDLGIGKDIGSNSSATQAHVGTWAYAAPEYFLDKDAGKPASDVFSWGATVAFAATGLQPYGGRIGPAHLSLVLRGSLDSDFIAAVKAFGANRQPHTEIAHLVLRCVDPQPEKRPADGNEVFRTIQWIVRG